MSILNTVLGFLQYHISSLSVECGIFLLYFLIGLVFCFIYPLTDDVIFFYFQYFGFLIVERLCCWWRYWCWCVFIWTNFPRALSSSFSSFTDHGVGVPDNHWWKSHWPMLGSNPWGACRAKFIFSPRSMPSIVHNLICLVLIFIICYYFLTWSGHHKWRQHTHRHSHRDVIFIDIVI